MTSPPPKYVDAADSAPHDQLPDSELVRLVIDKCIVHPEGEPWRPMYTLSHSPTEGACATVFGVERIRYRVAGTDGEEDIKARSDHIYDFRRDAEYPSRLEISGKSSSKRTYSLVRVEGGSKWLSCKAPGHFKAGQSLKQKMSKPNELEWTDDKGNPVATEILANRPQDGALAELPKLELKTTLEPKDLDLLVTLWVARIYKQTQNELEEPMSWGKFKRIASNPTQAGGYGKAFLG